MVFDERSTSSSDAAILPLPSTPPPALPSPSQPSTSAAPSAPSSSAPTKPLSSEGDSSDSSADEDPLVTLRVPRWLYQTVKDSGFSSVPSSSTSSGPRTTTRSRQSVEDNNFVNFALMSEILDTPPEPSSVEEALASPPWVATMQAELSCIERNGTWSLVPRPPKRKVIGVHWVFKSKYHADGSLDKHKARLVVIG